MRTAAEQAIYNAERPIYNAADALDKLLSQIAAFRSGLARLRLPIAAANDRLDHADDLAAILASQLNSAAGHINDEIQILQDAETARYDAAERAIDLDLARWTNRVRATAEAAGNPPANDDVRSAA